MTPGHGIEQRRLLFATSGIRENFNFVKWSNFIRLSCIRMLAELRNVNHVTSEDHVSLLL